MKQVAIITIAILLLGNAAFAADAPPSKPALPAWFDKPPEDAVNIIPMKQGFLVNGKRCSKLEFLKYALYQKVNAAPFISKKKKISGLSVVLRPEVGVQWARMQEAFTACAVNGIYRIYMQTGPDTVRRVFLPVDGSISVPFGKEVEGATRVILDPKEPDKVTVADESGANKVDISGFSAEWNKFEGRYDGIIQALPGVKGKDLLKAVRAMKKAGCQNVYYSPTVINIPHERFIFETPKILAEKIVEKPIIMMEEEVEITKDIPRGTPYDKLSGRNLDSTSIEDAYGIGGGTTGAYGQRRSKKSLLKEGGSPGTESAVLAGLRWLHFHQDKPSGKWDVDDYQKNCKGPGAPCSHMLETAPAGAFDAGVTGLALLAYLGHGQTHRVGKFKKTVRRGLKYLVRVQDNASGCFGNTEGESWIYNHAIATAAICEAYAQTRDIALKNPAQKAVDYIVQAQNPGYGWKYEPMDGKNDTSVTGWMVMVLHAAKKAKLMVPQSCFDGALAWLDRVTRVSDSKVGYMRPGDYGAKLAGRPPDTYKTMVTMTAVSVMCRIFCGQKRSHKKIQQGADILMANLPDYNKPKLDKVNFYYWYYGTYAMFQVGGPKWKTWNEAMKKALLKTQRAGRICQDGSWDPTGEWCVVGGRVYSTALAVLTLEAYYRYNRVNVKEKKKKDE